MKIVDVLGVKSFHDGERIIMQVSFAVAPKSRTSYIYKYNAIQWTPI